MSPAEMYMSGRIRAGNQNPTPLFQEKLSEILEDLESCSGHGSTLKLGTQIHPDAGIMYSTAFED